MLEYLWIYKHNNIEKQGFNFGNKYIYNFDYETRIVTRKEKIQILTPNFFGEKVKNVTAIIGENGTGKSSFFDFLAKINRTSYLWTDEELEKCYFVVIYSNSNSTKVFYCLKTDTNKSIKIDFESEIEEIKPFEHTQNKSNDFKYTVDSIKDKLGSFINLKFLFYSDTIDFQYRLSEKINSDNYLNLSSNFLTRQNQSSLNDFFKTNTLSLVQFFKDYYNSFNIFKLPSKIFLDLNSDLLDTQLISQFNDEISGKLSEINHFFKNILNLYKSWEKTSIDNDLKYKLKLSLLLLFSYLVKNSNYSKSQDSIHFTSGFHLNFDLDLSGESEGLILNIFEKLKTGNIEYLDKLNSLNNYINNENITLSKLREDYSPLLNDLFDINSENDIIQQAKSIKNEIGILSEIEELKNIIFDKVEKGTVTLEITSTEDFKKFEDIMNIVIAIFPRYQSFQIFNLGYDILLSSGELSLLKVFSRINSKKDKYKYKSTDKNVSNSFVFLLDEPDIFLHPEWQRKFLKYLIEFINTLFSGDFNIHIITTSHSPFFVADLPKENIIFLKKDENGNSKVKASSNMKETFGANIHTLLSDSFFMESTTGAFAKSKIDEALERLYKKDFNEKDREYVKTIINLVGESIIKRKLTQLLNEKNIINLSDVNSEIEQLKKRLEKLEKMKKNQGDSND